MTKTLPLGVKLARILNIMQAIISIVILFFILLTSLPLLLKVEPPTAEVVTKIGTVSVILLVIIVIAGWLVINLGKLNPAARRIQIIFSILGLFSFPIGTILNGIILYSMFRPDTKEAFGIIKV